MRKKLQETLVDLYLGNNRASDNSDKFTLRDLGFIRKKSGVWHLKPEGRIYIWRNKLISLTEDQKDVLRLFKKIPHMSARIVPPFFKTLEELLGLDLVEMDFRMVSPSFYQLTPEGEIALDSLSEKKRMPIEELQVQQMKQGDLIQMVLSGENSPIFVAQCPKGQGKTFCKETLETEPQILP